MNTRKKELEHFFDQYASRFNNALRTGESDVEAVASCFAEFFVEASPAGIIGGKNDDDFKKAIPKGYDFYKSIGITAMDILFKEITLLDDFHAMVKVHWKSSFTRKDHSGGSIEFDVVYLLQTKDETCKIFSYITGDEQKALKENGLTQ